MNGRNKRGRLHREWAEDVVEWCKCKGANLQELSHSAQEKKPRQAQDRSNWQKMIKQASDVNGHWAHD